MEDNNLIALIIGIFFIILLISYGVFASIIEGFIESFGLGYGLILGILFCMVIVSIILGGNKEK